MNINDLTKEDLEFIIDNFNFIRQAYDDKYGVYPDAVYFSNMSMYDSESYVIAVVMNVDNETVEFAEFDISNNHIILHSDLSKDKDEFLEEFTKVEGNLQFELLKLYDSKKENISNIEKTYYLRAKDILHEYKLI